MGGFFLFFFTRIVNFIVLAAALWLGLYVVTRSPRRLITWLTGLTLWSVAAICLNILLTLDPQIGPGFSLNWLELFLPAWQATGLERVAYAWLQGWSVMPTIAFWHHVTVLMRPGLPKIWRRIRVWGGYSLAGSVLLIQAFTPLFFATLSDDLLQVNPLQASPIYLVFIVFLLLYTAWSLINLIRSVQNAPTAITRQQLLILTAATVIAGLTGPLLLIGSIMGKSIPVIVLSLSLGGAVLLIGYGVAAYSALVEGRTIRRDFAYNALAITAITSVYLLAISRLTSETGVSDFTLAIVLILTIISHSLFDALHRHLNTHVYDEATRQVQNQLRQLTRASNEPAKLPEMLSPAFTALCASVRATTGLIFLFEEKEEPAAQLVSAYRWSEAAPSFSSDSLVVDDLCILKPGHFPPPLEEIALLIPLYADSEQLGAILLGRPVNGLAYTRAEVETLLDLSDRIADAIRDTRHATDRLLQTARLAEAHQEDNAQLTPITQVEITPKLVENALRNLSDYAHLGRHPLANLQLVDSRLTTDPVTHLDRGKALHTLLVEVIDKLRPNRNPPDEPPARNWYPYVILADAYLNDVPNRDIMSRLYISEGTFNRTRRLALRAVSRSLSEMETTLQPEN